MVARRPRPPPYISRPRRRRPRLLDLRLPNVGHNLHSPRNSHRRRHDGLRMRQIRNWYKLLEQSDLVANDSGPGVAQGTLSANVTHVPYYGPPESTITISGPLSPDATGLYLCSGEYNGFPYWFHAGWYIFSDAALSPVWWISETLGSASAAYWELDATSPIGEYTPQGTASGTATATSPYTIPNGYKGTRHLATTSKITSLAATGFPSAEGSIELMFRPRWNHSDGLYHYLWSTYGGSNRNFALGKVNTNHTSLITDNTSRGAFTFAWQAERLYHIVLNWGLNQLYINKTLVYDFTNGTLGSGSTTLYIGDLWSVANYACDGDILYFIARDTPLTLAEITTFYNFFTKLYAPNPM